MADNRRRSPNGWKTSTIAGQGVNGYFHDQSPAYYCGVDLHSSSMYANVSIMLLKTKATRGAWQSPVCRGRSQG